MKKALAVFSLLLAFTSSSFALDLSNKYSLYIDKLEEQRERISINRHLKSEVRIWVNNLEKLKNKRELSEKSRQTRASFRKELQEIL